MAVFRSDEYLLGIYMGNKNYVWRVFVLGGVCESRLERIEPERLPMEFLIVRTFFRLNFKLVFRIMWFYS